MIGATTEKIRSQTNMKSDEYAENKINLDSTMQLRDSWTLCLGQMNGSPGTRSSFRTDVTLVVSFGWLAGRLDHGTSNSPQES